MSLPMITADYSVGPAQQQYSTRSASVRETLPASTKASHHPNGIQLASSSENEMDSDSASVRESLPASAKASPHPNSIQLASSSENEMDSDYDWTQAMLDAGIPHIQIIGNILRWESPGSLFALLQTADSKIYAFDSGLGLCKGMYNYGKKVDPKDAPTWKQLFISYRANNWVEVIDDIARGNSMDGEERMVNYFDKSRVNTISNKQIAIVTAASPCNAKCADLLSKWAPTFNHLNILLQYFAPYMGQSIYDFYESVNTLQEYFYIMPVPLAHIDWVLFEAAGFRTRAKVQSYLSTVVNMNSYCKNGALWYDAQNKEMKIRYFNT